MVSCTTPPLLDAYAEPQGEPKIDSIEPLLRIATGLPIGTSFRSQDYSDNRHPNYVGDVGIGPNPDLAKRIDDADVLLVLGARLGEMTTGGYAMLTPPKTKQQLIHVHANPDEIGHVYVADRGVCCDPKAFLKTALDLVQEPLFVVVYKCF